MTLVTCETIAAITTHLREVTEQSPVNLQGHYPRPLALCGMTVAWDTRSPVETARCRDCLREIERHRKEIP